MPESKRDTNLQKGARVINAAIAELELPDEVKVSAQQVVTMFATDLLPGLWIRGAPPTPPAPKHDPAAATPADEADLLASLRREIATLTDTDDEDEIRVSSASTARADRRPRGRAAARSRRLVPVLTSVPLPLTAPASRWVTSWPAKVSEGKTAAALRRRWRRPGRE